MIDLRQKRGNPIRLVDISQISQLTGIRHQNGSIWVGSLTTMAQLASSQIILKDIPVLAKAASSVGSPQIRNLATVGGNLCHASPCADTVPPLVALNATLHLQSLRGIRQLPIEDFFLGPYRVAIDPHELLIGIEIPIPSSNLRFVFYKLGRRKALSIARLNLTVGFELKDNTISEAIISPGSILPTPGRVTSLEKKLINQKPEEKLFNNIGKELSELMVMEAGERWSTPYKKPVVAAVVMRCLMQCVENP